MVGGGRGDGLPLLLFSVRGVTSGRSTTQSLLRDKCANYSGELSFGRTYELLHL